MGLICVNMDLRKKSNIKNTTNKITKKSNSQYIATLNSIIFLYFFSSIKTLFIR